MINRDNGLRAAHEADDLNDLMLEFVLTGRKEALAQFLERGGKLDRETNTRLLISLLKDEFRADNKGGKDEFESFKVFVGVRLLMWQKGLSKTAACAEFSQAAKLRTPRAIEISYSKGSIIAEKIRKNRG